MCYCRLSWRSSTPVVPINTPFLASAICLRYIYINGPTCQAQLKIYKSPVHTKSKYEMASSSHVLQTFIGFSYHAPAVIGLTGSKCREAGVKDSHECQEKIILETSLSGFLIVWRLDFSERKYTKWSYYRPQTKFAKVMFLQVSVCPQGGRV